MRIGTIAQRSGLSIPTIRFYEKQGLIPKEAIRRLANSYRDFDGQVVETLKFIKYGQRVGFSLKEIVEISKERNLTRLSRKRQQDLLESKLEELDVKAKEIRVIQKGIKNKLKQLKNAPSRQHSVGSVRDGKSWSNITSR